jgi:hypothetical protein
MVSEDGIISLLSPLGSARICITVPKMLKPANANDVRKTYFTRSGMIKKMYREISLFETNFCCEMIVMHIVKHKEEAFKDFTLFYYHYFFLFIVIIVWKEKEKSGFVTAGFSQARCGEMWILLDKIFFFFFRRIDKPAQNYYVFWTLQESSRLLLFIGAGQPRLDWALSKCPTIGFFKVVSQTFFYRESDSVERKLNRIY